MYYIKKNNGGGIYHGKRNGSAIFYCGFFSNAKLYKSKANAERVIKRLRAEDYLIAVEMGK